MDPEDFLTQAGVPDLAVIFDFGEFGHGAGKWVVVGREGLRIPGVVRCAFSRTFANAEFIFRPGTKRHGLGGEKFRNEPDDLCAEFRKPLHEPPQDGDGEGFHGHFGRSAERSHAGRENAFLKLRWNFHELENAEGIPDNRAVEIATF